MKELDEITGAIVDAALKIHIELVPGLKDESLEESANLPAPEIIAQDITNDLEAALEQFATIAEDLQA